MNVLLVDDHVLFREGLALILATAMGEARIVHAGTCEEALGVVGREPPDLVLMDLGLPGLSGIDGIRLMRQEHPEIPVVALSSSDDRDTVLRALEAGAMGFIPKSSSAAVLSGALRLVLARGVYLPPSVFLEEILAGGQGRTAANVEKAVAPADLGITPRQADVLLRILQGKPAKLISRELGLSGNTVKVHTSAVLRALNVTTRTQAVVAASKLGLRFP
jgi:DNA-binding NarL/FixJ family response regulator